jgi:ketosteroid isomerase-like protein
MFERFTEKARRVIFFARYEASQYGSPFIETEHLLLGLMRENGALILRSLRPNCTAADLKSEIDKQIPLRQRISVSQEVPLTGECKKVLMRAKDEADRLGHRRIGAEHLLLGLLGAETSLAARLLRERGAEVEAVREQLAKTPGPVEETEMVPPRREVEVARRLEEAAAALENFLAALKSNNSKHLAFFFVSNSQFVDYAGKLWKGRAEIEKQFEMLIAPYAKKNVACRVESHHAGPFRTVLASVLWENVTVPGLPPRAMHRMTLVLAPESEDWAIYLLQVTPIITR